MNEPDSVIDAQLRHLLSVVEENRDARRETLLGKAREKARKLVKHAHREARERLHHKALAARGKARKQLAAAQAQRLTRQRLQQQQLDQALLARAWQPLREQMLQRWRNNDNRQLWIDQLVDQAAASLLNRQWRIQHPADWPATERVQLEKRLAAQLGAQPEFTEQTDIPAGLRICAGTACVDGTLDGLLRNRTEVESLMLAKLNGGRQRMAANHTPRET